MEFERKLQEAAVSEPDIDPAPANITLKKEKQINTMLADFVDDYRPAETHDQLIEQVHMAKEYGADSIEADPKLIRRLTLKSGYPSDVGYLWFHDVKVWIPGFSESHGHLLTQSIDAKVFGSSKVGGIMPVMDLGEKPK